MRGASFYLDATPRFPPATVFTALGFEKSCDLNLQNTVQSYVAEVHLKESCNQAYFTLVT